MTRPRLGHLAILALFLSAGCADNPTTSTTSTPPPILDAPAAYVFNRSASFDVERWAEQAPPNGPEAFAVGYPIDPLTGDSASVSPIRLAVANLTSKQYVEGPNGTRVGTASDIFASHGAGVAYVGFDAVPPGGTNDLQGWITWATYKDGKWDMEEAPARWALRDLRGLAFFDGAPRVLLRGPQAYEFWTLDGSWTSEIFPGLDPTRAGAAMAANATTLIIAGTDRAGQPTIWERHLGQTTFSADMLQDTPGLGGGGFYAVSALPTAPPAVAWTVHGLVAAPGMELLQTRLATRDADGWTLEGATVPDTAGPPQIAATTNGTFLLTSPTDGDPGEQIHWWTGTEWRLCEHGAAPRQRLLTIGDQAFLGYRTFTGGAALARLTTETASCLVGFDVLPGRSRT